MRPDDFIEFYHDLHRRQPFPWQRDLVSEIAERRCWPALVDVPTGLGKTTLLDIAVFFAAHDAGEWSPERIGRRRIFLVVDRRLVVDQAAEHARGIAVRLAQAHPGSAAATVAERLRGLSGDPQRTELLPVVTMRGGATWDAAWLPRPDLPGIVTGTVDQVGSRLFFRGYGVSSRRWPIDAALVGTDSLILVDEAHLATALTTTLASAERYDRASSQSLAVPPAAVVQMTATSTGTAAGWVPTFDEQAHLADPPAAARLTAAKTLRLETTTKAAAAKLMAAVASQQAESAGARVLVVCNTIDRARAVQAELHRTLPADVERLLLIGRSRTYDREPVVQRALELFGSGAGATGDRAVLVATQTIEVGVDLDSTGMVTESASWDALVQRMGRVNRRGMRDAAPVVVVQDDDPKPPVYGVARAGTVAFIRGLSEQEPDGIDVSPLALRKHRPPAEALLRRPIAPLLLPAHLDAWTRTGPQPANDAPLDPYLHGLDTGTAPVSLAWRDGLLNADSTPVNAAEANQLLDVIPVRAEECVEVPLSAVRRWLTDDKPVPVSDWEDDDDWGIAFTEDGSRSVVRRQTQPDGTTQWQWVQAAQLRPGDMVVAPSELGGLDTYGWSPSSKERVLDLAELAALQRGRPLLRLDQELPRRLGLPDPEERFWKLIDDWLDTDDPETAEELQRSFRSQVTKWLGAPQTGQGPWRRDDRLKRLAEWMSDAVLQGASSGRGRTQRHDDRFVTRMAILRPRTSSDPWQQASDDTLDGTVHLEQQNPATLADHGQRVRQRAEQISNALGLPPSLAGVVADAAGWHDLGKADPRFQTMLFHGDAMRAAIATEPRAKSGMPPEDRLRRWNALRRSGLPAGARHEAWSHALVAAHLARLAEPYPGDTELLLHLIASHHGHARPLLPPVLDEADHDLRVDLGGTTVVAELPRRVDLSHAERFQALNYRYGRWGLALLEAVVRCADVTVSGEGS